MVNGSMFRRSERSPRCSINNRERVCHRNQGTRWTDVLHRCPGAQFLPDHYATSPALQGGDPFEHSPVGTMPAMGVEPRDRSLTGCGRGRPWLKLNFAHVRASSG